MEQLFKYQELIAHLNAHKNLCHIVGFSFLTYKVGFPHRRQLVPIVIVLRARTWPNGKVFNYRNFDSGGKFVNDLG